MKYPDHIYNKFEIVEKEICGETHYGLVKVYNIFGMELKKHKRVESNCLDTTIGRIAFEGGQKWHSKLVTIQSAIDWDNIMKEYKFRNKVTK